jgi:hypothetical protein
MKNKSSDKINFSIFSLHMANGKRKESSHQNHQLFYSTLRALLLLAETSIPDNYLGESFWP